MPATPYAKLFVSINSGALADDGITAAVSDTVDLSAESTVGWPASGSGAPRWEIYGFPPSFTVPAGWSTDATTGAYYYLGTSPPQFTLTVWGKYMLRLLVQGGGGDKTDESTAITVPDATGLQDLGYRETSQFNAGWDDDQRANLRIIATGLGVAKAPANAQYLVGAAHADLSAEVVWTTIGTTVAFASTATQPCTFSRTDTSTTNAALTARTLIALGGTVANGFGVAEVYQAEGAGGTAIDAGSLACCWTDITGASEDAEWVLRSRKAGAALTDASTVAARISPLGVTLPALAGSGTRSVTADANGVLGTTTSSGGADATARYVVDATTATNANDQPLRSLAAALDFNRAAGAPVTLANTVATSGAKVQVLSLRRLTGGAGANDDGGYVSFTIPDSGSSETEAARLGWSWQAVTGTYGSVSLAVRDNLGLTERYTWASNGKFSAVNLAATALSTAGLLTNDASGNIVSNNAAVLSVGALTNVSNARNINDLDNTLGFVCDVEPPIYSSRIDASTDTVLAALQVHRGSSDVPAANIGAAIELLVDNTENIPVPAGWYGARLSTATDSAEVGELVFYARTGGSLALGATLTAAGVWTTVGAMKSDGGFDSATATALPIGASATSISVGSDATNTASDYRVTSGGTHTFRTNNASRLAITATTATFGTDTVKWVVGATTPHNGADATGAVTLDFSRSNVIEVSALVDNVTFTISGAVVGANYTVVVRQHASAAKTTTWASGLFASGDDAIGTTVGTYTAWQFVITDAGTIVCIGVKKDIVIP